MSRSTPVKRWCFTLNNYTVDEVSSLKSVLEKNSTYYVFGHEIGENQTPHLQGLVSFSKRHRLSSLKTLLGTRYHFEPCRVLSAAITYCKKDGKYEEWGDIPSGPDHSSEQRMNTKEVVASDWFQLAAKGRDGLEEFTKRHPVEMLWHGHVFVKNYMFTIRPPFRKNVRCMWIHGPSGVGKSKFAYEKMPSAFRKDPYTKWWDNYFHETQCIIDEFEPQQIPVGYLLQWLDPYPVYVE
ncbi:hypothetical protein V6M83_00055, partial [Streptococcus anginosus]|uniref:hypothetical protein n=1 Tax=Streptococcus anginosus TaxID=1328 RepID=UPI002FF1B893